MQAWSGSSISGDGLERTLTNFQQSLLGPVGLSPRRWNCGQLHMKYFSIKPPVLLNKEPMKYGRDSNSSLSVPSQSRSSIKSTTSAIENLTNNKRGRYDLAGLDERLGQYVY